MKNYVYVIKNRTIGEGLGTMESIVGVATDFATAMKAAGRYMVGVPEGGNIKIWTKEKKYEMRKEGDVAYGLTVYYGSLTDYYWVEEMEALT